MKPISYKKTHRDFMQGKNSLKFTCWNCKFLTRDWQPCSQCSRNKEDYFQGVNVDE